MNSESNGGETITSNERIGGEKTMSPKIKSTKTIKRDHTQPHRT